jgi:enoyl-CoA hydratase
MTYQTLLTSLEHNIFTITINRPEKLNALSATVIDELAAAVEEVYTNPNIKSAIITGAGHKAFVAGADIGEFLKLDRAGGKHLSQKGHDKVFNKIERCPKPIVAAINGFALGGGCELAMACHFRLCSHTAQLGQPEVTLGIIPGYGGTQRLTQLVGKGRSMEMQLTGKLISAAEALAIGLVNHVTGPEELLEKTIAILQVINTKAPLAIAKIIDCVNVAATSDSAYTNGKSGFEVEIDAFTDCFASADMKEGITAFLEKRKANFTGE